MTTETLTSFFGWLAVINIAYMTLATLAIASMRRQMIALHQSLFGLNGKDLQLAYFNWLGFYKTTALIFSVMPYIALKLI